MNVLEGSLTIPGVSSVVLGTAKGELVGSHEEEEDAETLAAVAGFAASTMSEGAEHLGLGELEVMRVQGPTGNTVVLSSQQQIMIARLADKAQLTKATKALRELLLLSEAGTE